MTLNVAFEAGTTNTDSVKEAQRLAQFLSQAAGYVTIRYIFNGDKVLVGPRGLIYALRGSVSVYSEYMEETEQ